MFCPVGRLSDGGQKEVYGLRSGRWCKPISSRLPDYGRTANLLWRGMWSRQRPVGTWTTGGGRRCSTFPVGRSVRQASLCFGRRSLRRKSAGLPLGGENVPFPNASYAISSAVWLTPNFGELWFTGRRRLCAIRSRRWRGVLRGSRFCTPSLSFRYERRRLPLRRRR